MSATSLFEKISDGRTSPVQWSVRETIGSWLACLAWLFVAGLVAFRFDWGGFGVALGLLFAIFAIVYAVDSLKGRGVATCPVCFNSVLDLDLGTGQTFVECTSCLVFLEHDTRMIRPVQLDAIHPHGIPLHFPDKVRMPPFCCACGETANGSQRASYKSSEIQVTFNYPVCGSHFHGFEIIGATDCKIRSYRAALYYGALNTARPTACRVSDDSVTVADPLTSRKGAQVPLQRVIQIWGALCALSLVMVFGFLQETSFLQVQAWSQDMKPRSLSVSIDGDVIGKTDGKLIEIPAGAAEIHIHDAKRSCRDVFKDLDLLPGHTTTLELRLVCRGGGATHSGWREGHEAVEVTVVNPDGKPLELEDSPMVAASKRAAEKAASAKKKTRVDGGESSSGSGAAPSPESAKPRSSTSNTVASTYDLVSCSDLCAGKIEVGRFLSAECVVVQSSLGQVSQKKVEQLTRRTVSSVQDNFVLLVDAHHAFIKRAQALLSEMNGARDELSGVVKKGSLLTAFKRKKFNKTFRAQTDVHASLADRFNDLEPQRDQATCLLLSGFEPKDFGVEWEGEEEPPSILDPNIFRDLNGNLPNYYEPHEPRKLSSAKAYMDRLESENPPNFETPMLDLSHLITSDHSYNRLVRRVNAELRRRRFFMLHRMDGQLARMSLELQRIVQANPVRVQGYVSQPSLWRSTFSKDGGKVPAAFIRERQGEGTLAQRMATSADVLVTSIPSGAKVTLSDGTKHKTPFVIHRQKVGSNISLKAKATGYKTLSSSHEVTATVSRISEFELVLQAK